MQEFAAIDNKNLDYNIVTKDYLEEVIYEDLNLFAACPIEQVEDENKLYEDFLENLKKDFDTKAEGNSEEKIRCFEENIKKFQTILLLKNTSVSNNITLNLVSNSNVLSANETLRNIIQVLSVLILGKHDFNVFPSCSIH